MHLNDVTTQAMLKAQEDSLSQQILEDLIVRVGLFPYMHGQVRGCGCRAGVGGMLKDFAGVGEGCRDG